MKRVNERNIKVLAGNGYIVAKGRRYPSLKNENEDTYTETDYQMQLEMLKQTIYPRSNTGTSK